MAHHPSRKTILAFCIGGTLLCLSVLFFQVISNLRSRWTVDRELPGAWSATATADIPAQGTPTNKVMPVESGENLRLTGNGPDDRVLDTVTQQRIDKLIQVSLANPVNRTVSLCLVGKTLDVIQQRTDPQTRLNGDVVYFKEYFIKLARKIEKQELSAPQLRRIVNMGVASVKDRQISEQELTGMINMLNTELSMDLDQERVESMLHNLREPATRDELKRIFKEETNTIVKSSLANPVIRRLLLLSVEQAFAAYEQEIYRKLPPQADRQAVKLMVQRTITEMAANRLTGQQVETLTSLCIESAADKRITREEMEKITGYLKTALHEPTWKIF